MLDALAPANLTGGSLVGIDPLGITLPAMTPNIVAIGLGNACLPLGEFCGGEGGGAIAHLQQDQITLNVNLNGCC